jgi:hypothetical protein
MISYIDMRRSFPTPPNGVLIAKYGSKATNVRLGSASRPAHFGNAIVGRRVDVMRHYGHERFLVAAHDRGARVAVVTFNNP